MKIIKIFLLLFSLAALISGCVSEKETVDKENYNISGLEKGSYNFIMYDSSGAKLADGNFSVDTIKNDIVTGTYSFKNKYKSFSGFSIMNGRFRGEINRTENTVTINTNPRVADANTFFTLKRTSEGLSGTWIHTLFRGSIQGGKFTAKKL
jgi:hypothetical protein